ncbi:hypothetical protein TWF281_006344 [Arthrobotrys megalospora]
MPKQTLMCARCRKDKKCCLPKPRKWPGRRCDRCIKYNYRCSASTTSAEQHPDDEQEEGEDEHKKLRPVKEIVEDLDYLIYLERAIENPQLIDPLLKSGWDFLSQNAKKLAEHVVDRLATKLIEEAEATRDSLVMRARYYEAEAIEGMLLRSTRAQSEFKDTHYFDGRAAESPGPSRSAPNRLSSRILKMEVYCGRVFTALGYLEDWNILGLKSPPFPSLRPTLVPYFGDSNGLLGLFVTALGVRKRFLAKCQQVNVEFSDLGLTGLVNQPPGLTNFDSDPDIDGMVLEDLQGVNVRKYISWIDPVGLRAMRYLPFDEAFQFFHEHIFENSGDRHDHGGCECGTSSGPPTTQTPDNSHPLIRETFLIRLEEERSRTRLPQSLSTHPADRLELRDSSCLGDTNRRRRTLELVSGVGLSKISNHPLRSADLVEDMLQFEVGLHAVGLGVILGGVRIELLEDYQLSITSRFWVSDVKFVCFLGPNSRRYEFTPNPPLLHQNRWNIAFQSLNSLHSLGPGSFLRLGWPPYDEERLRDVVDFYVTAIMYGDALSVNSLEDFATASDFSHLRGFTQARDTITSIATDFAPFPILKAMMERSWFQDLSYEKSVKPRLRQRAMYWESVLGTKKHTPDVDLLYELHRQGYEAYCCGRDTIGALGDLSLLDSVTQLRLDRLAQHVTDCRRRIFRQTGRIQPVQASLLPSLVGEF